MIEAEGGRGGSKAAFVGAINYALCCIAFFKAGILAAGTEPFVAYNGMTRRLEFLYMKRRFRQSFSQIWDTISQQSSHPQAICDDTQMGSKSLCLTAHADPAPPAQAATEAAAAAAAAATEAAAAVTAAAAAAATAGRSSGATGQEQGQKQQKQIRGQQSAGKQEEQAHQEIEPDLGAEPPAKKAGKKETAEQKGLRLQAGLCFKRMAELNAKAGASVTRGIDVLTWIDKQQNWSRLKSDTLIDPLKQAVVSHDRFLAGAYPQPHHTTPVANPNMAFNCSPTHRPKHTPKHSTRI